MPDQNDPFFPRHVDEFIEEITSSSKHESQHMGPERHMIHDLRSLYGPERKRFSRALQRVEDRLVEQRLGRQGNASIPSSVTPLQEEQRFQARQAHQGKKIIMNNDKSPRASRLKRRLGLLAAILTITVLVGSLLLVLNYTRRSSTTASGPSPTSTLAPSPTATPSPTQSTANLGHIVYTYPTSNDDFYAFAWSPDTKRIASSTAGIVTIQDATTGKHSVTFTPPGGVGGSILALSWSANGKYLAVGSGQLFIINAMTGALIRTFPDTTGLTGNGSGAPLGAHLPFSGGNMVYATAWSPDGKLMATSLNGGAYGNIIDIWNTSNGQVIYTFRGQTSDSGPSSVSWSADGKYIASASYSGSVQVWDAHTGQVIFSKDNCGNQAAWAPAGMELAFSCNSTLQVWNVATKKQITSQKDSSKTGSALVWSPDGKKIANTSNNNVVIWNATNGKTIYTFTRQGSQYVRALAWSPDGKYIVSGGGNEAGGNHALVWTAN